MLIPTDHLERCGIAWPNPAMFKSPVLNGPPVKSYGSEVTPAANGSLHRRNFSSGSAHASSPMSALPVPPPPTPILQNFYNFLSSAPNGIQNEASYVQPYSGVLPYTTMSDAFHNAKAQYEVRLPNNQLQKLILAMSSPKEQEMSGTASTQAMPPPPLPAHALAAKIGAIDGKAKSETLERRLADAITITNRSQRDDSHGSDVSMHTGCAYFPTCTTEDDSSQVVHSSPAAPPSSIKGRKEGSSPVKCKLAS